MNEKIKDFCFNFTEQDLKVIGIALSELPFKIAFPLINKIELQIKAQNDSSNAETSGTS